MEFKDINDLANAVKDAVDALTDLLLNYGNQDRDEVSRTQELVSKVHEAAAEFMKEVCKMQSNMAVSLEEDSDHCIALAECDDEELDKIYRNLKRIPTKHARAAYLSGATGFFGNTEPFEE